MNRFTAPCRTDAAHHRNHFPPTVRAALGLLDRVAEGQDIAEADIDLALQVTGDVSAHIAARESTREHTHANARMRAFAEHARAEGSAA